MPTPDDPITTVKLVAEIATASCVPVTQLRAHWDRLAGRVIRHLKAQDVELAQWRNGARRQ